MKYYHVSQIFEPKSKVGKIRERFAQSAQKYLYENGVIPIHKRTYKRNSKDYGDSTDGCFFKDVIEAGIEVAENDDDVIIYTNTDSCLSKNIFAKIQNKIEKFDCCYGKRRGLPAIIPSHHLSDSEMLNLPYTKYGACVFAFTKKWWNSNKNKLADCILPKGMWDNNLVYLIKQASLDTRLDNSVYHIQHDSTWLKGISDPELFCVKL